MVAWFPLVEGEQTLQSGNMDFGGKKNVTTGCVAWSDDGKALPRVCV